jgi:hypothetical protein
VCDAVIGRQPLGLGALPCPWRGDHQQAHGG